MRRVDWAQVDTVLLDMDGTLLDLHFDHMLWNVRLPEHYAASRSLALEAARETVQTRLRAAQGTLEWYCLDHWSRVFGFDLGELEQRHADGIRVHTGVPEFLRAVAGSGRRLVLATNAHRRSLALKMQRTGLAGHFHALVSAHDYGAPKEDAEFWRCLRGALGFQPARALFIDDNLAVLRAARRFGIGQVWGVACPDSRAPRLPEAEFPQLQSFAELLPATPSPG